MHVHSLGQLPAGAKRAYYVYLLDYGWADERATAMFRNFERMADLASRHDAVVIRGCVAQHFADEVLSWHHINGRDSKDLLPAILITTRHPEQFRNHGVDDSNGRNENDRLLIVPLRGVCDGPDDVVPLLAKIFTDIENKRALRDFEVSELMRAGDDGAVRDAVVLRHASGGHGTSLDMIERFFDDPNTAKPCPDVLLVTVNQHETDAVLRAFTEATGQRDQPKTINGRVYRDLGSINGSRMFHARSEAGSSGPGGSQQTIDKAIRALNPGAVIAIGVAFGVNEASQAVGDVLVSTQVRSYEPQRVGEAIILRGDRVHASPRLIDFFKSAIATWNASTVRAGLVLSGDKLVDDIGYRDRLKEQEPEAIGGEMEGSGLYVSCQDHRKDWIIVKAICDWADGNKGRNKTGRQKKAALMAANFLVHALRHAALSESSPPPI
jgi:nucleoside phosphorylase